MLTNKIISIIGGDERQKYLIKFFTENDCIVKIIGFENRNVEYSNVIICSDILDAVRDSDYIILGLPVEKNIGYIYAPLSDRKFLTEEVFEYADKNSVIFGGLINDNIKTLAKKHSIKLYDYSKDDMFAYLNAIPTAEGCIKIIIGESNISIDGMNCLVTGFGKTAKILAYKLKQLGANITVAARNKLQLYEALALGYNTCNIDNLRNNLYGYNVIVNMVPHLIFDKDLLSVADKETVFIDLASLPGGIDFNFASNNGIKAVQALGLPAKTAPITAAEIIYKTVCNAIEEEF